MIACTASMGLRDSRVCAKSSRAGGLPPAAPLSNEG